MLDPTAQRIVGVLIEKELSVPESYPMSENALVDGCNQKSNRDPVTELVAFQVAGSLMALQELGWIARIDGGGRVPKFRHKVVEKLALDRKELAVLAELLLRGPQAPGALKPRVQRMGFVGSPEEIEAMLTKLASRPEPLVAQLAHRPRERDRRWQHLLGGSGEDERNAGGEPQRLEKAVQAPAAAATATAAPMGRNLEARVSALELLVAALRSELAGMKSREQAGE